MTGEQIAIFALGLSNWGLLFVILHQSWRIDEYKGYFARTDTCELCGATTPEV